MKKTLLLTSLSILVGQGMSAIDNQEIPNFYVMGISPNGQYAVSVDWTRMIIRDLPSGQEWSFESSESEEYSCGNGNSVSDNGIVVGSQTPDMDGSYFKDGEWHTIFSCTGFNIANLNGITADGSRICGAVTNLDNTLGYDGTTLVPMYIDALGDGFGDVVMLPRPETDFVGHLPIYITALQISEDGHTIYGQVMDYSGAIVYPIIYKEDADGKWDYSLPTEHLLNPSGLELPELGEHPVAPDPTDYMTDEAKAEYELAMQEFIDSGYDPDLYPNAADYLTIDQLEAYNNDVDEYNAEAEIYNQQLEAYYEVWDQILEESTTFVFNSGTLSPDGTKLSLTIEKPGLSFWDPSSYCPAVLDITTGELKEYKVEGVNLIAGTITDDGAMVASNPIRDGVVEAYILTPDADRMISLYQYFQWNAPATAAWMDQHMRHDIETYDMETWEPYILPNVLITGVAYGSRDLSTLAFGAQTIWEAEDPTYSYVINNSSSSVSSAADVDEINVKAQNGGVLLISGKVENIEIYSINGSLVYSTVAPASVVETHLQSGVYLVHTTSINGIERTFKVYF